MGEMSLDNLSSQYFDVLKELGNIGAGNATTALAQMLNKKVDMSVPQVKLLDFKDVGDLMGGAEQIMTGIYLSVEGDINGSIMFLLPMKSARHIVDLLMGQTGKSEEEGFDETELSAIKEVGNIITGSYLNSLSMITNLKLLPSVPFIAIDMAGAILSVPAIEFGMMGDKILLIETSFFDTETLSGYFILLPDVEGYGKILSSLGMGDMTTS
ncbi:MAG: chemotaxis protein CheC [Butyrivibrio sp.]|nr:chemotaxis protein CheC [Butyrivibrio sp.]